SRTCPTVEAEHHGVGATDDEQGGGPHAVEGGSGEVGATTTHDDGLDRFRRRSGRRQGGCRSGARPEQADRYPLQIRARRGPSDDVDESIRQQFDVEHARATTLLVGGEEIEQQGREPGVDQEVGHEAVPWAVAAAPGPVSEHDDSDRIGRYDEVAVE
ncbi:MAG: hypothetical protein RLZZ01_1195, partial [Actinomycetota bacterium]